MLLYAVTIFVSAFLLFQVQPVIARSILPWFGGSAAVWTTCLLFFQVALLGGYVYSHVVVKYLRPRKQMLLHLTLLALSLLSLPIIPKAALKPTGAEEPTARILLLLLLTVGLPYFLLSTTGPLLQAWFAVGSGTGKKRAFPYQLYSLSNLGSMLALVSYPVGIEPFLPVHMQAWTWSAGYVVFAALCGTVAWRACRDRSHEYGTEGHLEEPEVPLRTAAVPPAPGDYLLWLLLAACSSSMLLAVTNHMSQNIAAIPFLWVLPLSLYLLSFIIVFGPREWRWGKAFLPMPAMALGVMAYASSSQMTNPKVEILVPVFSIGLFICCMLCHGELARLKPHPKYLTAFYMMMSLGGALGGVFVALVAPRYFPGHLELQVSIIACALLALATIYWEPSAGRRSVPTPSWAVMALLTMAMVWYVGSDVGTQLSGYRKMVRNFYGVLKVSDSDASDEDGTRTLTNGTIDHGQQYLAPARHMEPITYYTPDSGIALAIKEAQRRPHNRVAVIGLGTGTVAAFGRRGDDYTYYEINPLVKELAYTEFSFLPDSKAHVNVVMGDARLSMEQQPAQNYDVIAVDAFSSDSIPVHLLTKEAFELYFRQLKPGGVLAVHISNRYLDLKPVVLNEAQELGKEARIVETDSDDDVHASASSWVLVTSRREIFKDQLLKSAEPLQSERKIRTWTDDYSNLFQILVR